MKEFIAKPLRTVRSFTRRLGRMTSGQTRALEILWPLYGIDFKKEMISMETVFGRSAPCLLDIGFGRGESTLAFAQNHPEWNVIGVEVHLPGIGHLLHTVHAAKLSNVRIIRHDVVEVLQQMIPADSLERVQLFFPDPWHKKKHHKRRLVQVPFIELLLEKLVPGGSLFFATDWEDYAEQMLTVLETFPALQNQATESKFIERPTDRPATKFEERGIRLGHPVFDMHFCYETTPNLSRYSSSEAE